MRKTTCLLMAAVILAAADQGSALPPLLSYDRWVITPHGFPDVDSPLIQAWPTNKNLPRDTVEISSAYVKRAEDFWKEKPSGKLPNEAEVPTRFHYVPVRVVQRHEEKLVFLGWLWMMREVVDFYHASDAQQQQMVEQQLAPQMGSKGWAYFPRCRWIVNPDLPSDTVELLSCDGKQFLSTEKDGSFEHRKSLDGKYTLTVRVVQRQSKNGELKYLGFRPFNAEAVRLLHGGGASAGKIVVEELVDEHHPERFRVEP